MSSLTKKLLFFFLLSIVYKSTLSDETDDCIANVREIFIKYEENENEENKKEIDEDNETPRCFPYFCGKTASTSASKSTKNEENEDEENKIGQEQIGHFMFAMFALSESVVNSLKESPAELLNLYEEKKEYIPTFDKKNWRSEDKFKEVGLDQIHKYFDLLKEYNTSNNVNNNTSLESKKKDIMGYSQLLFNQFENSKEVINIVALAPGEFCQKYFKTSDDKFMSCNKALRAMLGIGEDCAVPKAECGYFKMKGYNALKHCYQNYSYFYFTADKKDEEEEEDLTFHDHDFEYRVKYNYFFHMVHVSQQITAIFKDKITELFPTVEEYCSTRR